MLFLKKIYFWLQPLNLVKKSMLFSQHTSPVCQPFLLVNDAYLFVVDTHFWWLINFIIASFSSSICFCKSSTLAAFIDTSSFFIFN